MKIYDTATFRWVKTLSNRCVFELQFRTKILIGAFIDQHIYEMHVENMTPTRGKKCRRKKTCNKVVFASEKLHTELVENKQGDLYIHVFIMLVVKNKTKKSSLKARLGACR